MRMGTQSRFCAFPVATTFFSVALVIVFIILSSQPANALPAFARKYGLRCSACHESWPMLNYFGQKFKDNGYQLMNDRDAPIWQNPGYWPVTFRITPIWHRVSTGKVEVDTYPGGGSTTSNGTAIQRVTTSGFDLSGLDFHTGGTLEKNFSFYVLPSSDNTASFHFETVMARLDNLFGSPWLNIKLGKFELDNLLSEKRILTLTGNGGIYQLYHFIPVGDGNIFGQMGDNQLGAELMGHSYNDRTRYSAALLSSTDGNVGLPYGNAYTGFFAASQAFDVGQTRSGSHRRLRHDRTSANVLFDSDRGWSHVTPCRLRGKQQVVSSRRLRRAVLLRSALRLAGGYPARLGQRLVRAGLWRPDQRDCSEQQRTGHHAAGRFASANVERRSVRTALHLQPAAYFHRAVREHSNVAAGQWAGLGHSVSVQLGQHLDLHRRLSLQPLHDQPRRLCLAQRIQLAASRRDRADAWINRHQHKYQRIAARI